MKTYYLKSFGNRPLLRVVDDGNGSTCIGASNVTRIDAAGLFLDLLEVIKGQSLALRGSETRALAFLMATHGCGQLWFAGTFDPTRLTKQFSLLME